MNEINTKEIVCYLCKKTSGTARQRPRFIWVGKGIERTGKEVHTWYAKGFKMISIDLWLCDKCDRNNKCLHCKILLSNKIKCRCGNIHGSFYPNHPKYCKGCWDKRFKLT